MDCEYVDKIMSGINVDDKLSYSTVKVMMEAAYESGMEAGNRSLSKGKYIEIDWG